MKNRAASLGEDGITCTAMRVQAALPNSPMLKLFKQSQRLAILPNRWTHGFIIPIRKQNIES